MEEDRCVKQNINGAVKPRMDSWHMYILQIPRDRSVLKSKLKIGNKSLEAQKVAKKKEKYSKLWKHYDWGTTELACGDLNLIKSCLCTSSSRDPIIAEMLLKCTFFGSKEGFLVFERFKGTRLRKMSRKGFSGSTALMQCLLRLVTASNHPVGNSLSRTVPLRRR